MFRIGVTKHLRNVATTSSSLIPPAVMGPHLRPATPVNLGLDCPVRNVLVPRIDDACQKVPLRTVADELRAVAIATRAKALAAPSLGYDAHVVVIHSDLDTRVLINPEITTTSQATSTSWEVDGDLTYRVVRPRTVSVKYTNLDGDKEEWFSLAAEESAGLQRAMDTINGVSTIEHVAPCVAAEPSLYPNAVKSGLVGILPTSLFESYKAHLSLLVDIKSLHRHLSA